MQRSKYAKHRLPRVEMKIINTKDWKYWLQFSWNKNINEKYDAKGSLNI